MEKKWLVLHCLISKNMISEREVEAIPRAKSQIVHFRGGAVSVMGYYCLFVALGLDDTF